MCFSIHWGALFSSRLSILQGRPVNLWPCGLRIISIQTSYTPPVLDVDVRPSPRFRVKFRTQYTPFMGCIDTVKQTTLRLSGSVLGSEYKSQPEKRWCSHLGLWTHCGIMKKKKIHGPKVLIKSIINIKLWIKLCSQLNRTEQKNVIIYDFSLGKVTWRRKWMCEHRSSVSPGPSGVTASPLTLDPDIRRLPRIETWHILSGHQTPTRSSGNLTHFTPCSSNPPRVDPRPTVCTGCL